MVAEQRLTCSLLPTADVTLAYEDGQQGEAHKVMLSYHIFHLWSCKAQQEGAEQRETECGRLREGRLQLPPQLSSLPLPSPGPS